MKFKGIIFDLDGTLVNSLEDIADSMNKVLMNHGFPIHDIDAYKYFIGNGIKNLVRKTIPDAQRNEALIEECYKSMTEIYSRNYLNKTKPYHGIKELLSELSKLNLKLAVLSNKTDDFTKKIIAKFFPDINFTDVRGLTNEAYKKPDPKAAIEIAAEFKLHPDEIVYIGDTSVDMQTAVNAGMYPAGVLWGFREKEELLTHGAQFILEQPMDLFKLLKQE